MLLLKWFPRQIMVLETVFKFDTVLEMVFETTTVLDTVV